jgi:hypothetical protein
MTGLSRTSAVRGGDRVPVMDLEYSPVGQLDRECFEWDPCLEKANLVSHIVIRADVLTDSIWSDKIP